MQRTGNITGAEAVQFFSRSKLPVDALKSIWTLADTNPTTNTLDKSKFAVAVRLIQLQQNGERGSGPTLQTPPGKTLRPVFFEGVASPPPPPQQMGQRPPSAPSSPRGDQRPVAGATGQHPPRPPMQAHQSPQQQRPSMAGGQGPPLPSMALATQDPYTLTPADQARYEGVFADYTKPDGYVYGPQAVELFSKSGVPQPELARIWNMVDQPVDNRLDKLEFCFAMHLIVCVSKKNLPLPASLPMSLKNLKSQQQAAATMGTGLSVASGGASAGGGRMGSPSSMQQGMVAPPPGQPQPPQMQLNMSAPPSPGQPPSIHRQPQAPPMAAGTPVGGGGGPPPIQPSPSGLSGPPPLQQPGGVNISDAFEGLSAADSGAQYMASTPLPGGATLAGAAAAVPASVTIETPSSPLPPPAPAVATMAAGGGLSVPDMSTASSPPPPVDTRPPIAAAAATPPPPKSTEQLASSYDMGSAHEELRKLKDVMQKLQAENISLKAQVGTLSEDEKDVQKQLSATVSEIGELSNELTTLRAQVLASKSRLLDATAELKAAQEKKGCVPYLVVELRRRGSYVADNDSLSKLTSCLLQSDDGFDFRSESNQGCYR